MSAASLRRPLVLAGDRHFTSLALERRLRLERRHRRGPDIDAAVLLAVSSARHDLVVEVGGSGALAGLMRTYISARVLAVDGDAALLADAHARGFDAVVADVRRLPLGDTSVDCVVADRVLRHRREVVDGLPEICRVLRDDGMLVAVARSNVHDGHELDDLLGVRLRARTDVLSAETGPELLAAHFRHVEAQTLDYVLEFPDGATAASYVSTLPGGQAHAAGVADISSVIRLAYGVRLFVATHPRPRRR